MNSALNFDKRFIFFSLIAGALIGLLPFLPLGVALILAASLCACILIGVLIYNGVYDFLAAPFLLLIAGTFAFGRAFSILGINIGIIPIFVTEMSLICAFGLVLFYGKVPNFKLCLPSDILNILFAYLIFGTIYLIYGLTKNGPLALRDIVYCHYSLFLFVTLIIFRTKQKLEYFLWIMLLSGICALLVGLNIFVKSIPDMFFLEKFLSHTRNFNINLYYGLLIIFGLSYFSYLKEKRILVSILVILSLIMNVLFRSSTVWIATIIAILFLCIISRQEIRIFIESNIIIILLIFIAILVLCSIFPDILSGLKYEFKGLFRWGRYEGAGCNVVWRFHIWNQTLSQTAERPFFGWGFGVYPRYSLWGWTPPPVTIIGPGSEIVPTHNHILGMTYKFGMAGTLFFLIINFRIFFYGLLYIKKCKIEFNRRFLIACLTGIIYWHCTALFFDIIESPPTSIFLWVLLGLTLCVVNIDKNDPPYASFKEI